MAIAMTASRHFLFGLLLAVGACGRSGLGDLDTPNALGGGSAGDGGVATTPPPTPTQTPTPEDAGAIPDASVDPPNEDADTPRICPVDAGGTLLDTTDCAAREVVACVPFYGGTVQDTLDEQIFMGNCQHRDGAGGFTVRFDREGCAVEISGGLFTACDVAWVSSRRFACAEGHSCATAPTLVK